jgi:two-component system, probable response regulator PhcQ
MSYSHNTVLFVDDEPEILDSLRRTLRDETYRILTTTSATDALRRIEEGTVDLLITDLDMPEMSGVELLHRVRVSRPDVVRILITGHASLDSAIKAINDGEVHRYLTKPWSKGELRETIRQALDRLEELRRAADAGRRALVRGHILEELEREHPGITVVPAQGDVHVVDAVRVDAVLAEVGDARLSSFLGRSMMGRKGEGNDQA